MKFEVVESAGEWIVRGQGVELARFHDQDVALNDVAARLRALRPVDVRVSLAVRYEHRETVDADAAPQMRISK